MNKVIIETEKEIAFDSPDHIQPHGTKQDNSTNLAFNAKLRSWLSPESLRVMDVGCSGGGFVKSVLDEGDFAVGIEGSDYSKKNNRAEWVTIPESLFTTDATADFQLLSESKEGTKTPIKFNVITAWEFIEHIKEEDLPNVMANFDKHLSAGGVIIISISPNEEVVNGITLHQCVHESEWWYAKFSELGYTNHEVAVKYFENDMVRWDANAPGSFHVVLTRHAESIPNLSVLTGAIIHSLTENQKALRKQLRLLGVLILIISIAAVLSSLL